MKTILNILLLLVAIAWTYYGNTNKAHAYTPSEPIENTYKFVDGNVWISQTTKVTSLDITDVNTSIYEASSYFFIEDSLQEHPNILISRLLGSLAGSGTSVYGLERLSMGLEYEKLLVTRNRVAESERSTADSEVLRKLDIADKALLRDKDVLERNFPFVRTLARPNEDENDIRTMIRPFLDTTFYQLDIDETMAAVEKMWTQLQSGNIRDNRKFVATFLVWEIFQERMNEEKKFICESPVCESDSGSTDASGTVELNSAPPVETYFFEDKFGVLSARWCGDGTFDTPENPCREVPENLTKAVTMAVESFQKNVGEFDESEFYRIFMSDDSQKYLLDFPISPDDPVGSGERLAWVYLNAMQSKKAE